MNIMGNDTVSLHDLDFATCAGHSMGGALASIAAGDHASVVKSVFLIDPVDYTPGSSRSSPAALTM